MMLIVAMTNGTIPLTGTKSRTTTPDAGSLRYVPSVSSEEYEQILQEEKTRSGI
jgi:hypothetical protein